MKKFFCDLGCFFLVLALIMTVGAMIEGTLPFWPALFAGCCIGLLTGGLYQLGFHSLAELFPRRAVRRAVRRVHKPHTVPASGRTLPLNPAAKHRLGAA